LLTRGNLDPWQVVRLLLLPVPMRASLLLMISGLVLVCDCQRTFDCEKVTPNVALHVVDAATKMPIDRPTFSESGEPFAASCASPTDGGACPTWVLVVVGAHTLVVGASGHASVTLSLDGGVVDADRCPNNPGWTQHIEQTVELPAQ
jgi:hypothetical protein